MARKTKQDEINRLKEIIKVYEEAQIRADKRIAELVSAEEHTFLHSPTYIQMEEQIKWWKNLCELTEINYANAKQKLHSLDDTISKLYQDNRAFMDHEDCVEYFVGISKGWRDAGNRERLEKEIIELQSKIEQQKEAIKNRDDEVARLQMEIAKLLNSKKEH